MIDSVPLRPLKIAARRRAAGQDTQCDLAGAVSPVVVGYLVHYRFVQQPQKLGIAQQHLDQPVERLGGRSEAFGGDFL